MRECQNETRACALADRTCRSQDTEAAGHHLHLPELMEPVNLVQLQFVEAYQQTSWLLMAGSQAEAQGRPYSTATCRRRELI
jgi:hypothetical protein